MHQINTCSSLPECTFPSFRDSPLSPVSSLGCSDLNRSERTCALRIDDASHPDDIPGFELGHVCADCGDAPHDFAAGHAGVNGWQRAAPLVACRMEVRMADATEQDFDLNVAERRGMTVEARGEVSLAAE